MEAADADRPETADVLRGRDMLCFGHDWSWRPPIEDAPDAPSRARQPHPLDQLDRVPYRLQASARDLRRAFNKLKAVAEPVKEVEKNIFVLNPLAIPAYGIPWMRTVNRALLRLQILRAMRRLGLKRPINWVFNPMASVVAGSLREELLVYYCVDEFTAFSDAGTRSMIELEDQLIGRADLVIVSAERLLRSKGGKNPHTVLVRHGVDYDHFRKALLPETRIPEDIADLPHPIIGYFGLMAADWIDIDLMVHVAKHFMGGSLVLLGKVTTDMSQADLAAECPPAGPQALRGTAVVLEGLRRRDPPSSRSAR